MGVWLFFSEWFGDVPSRGTLLKRSMINAAWAIVLVLVLMWFQAPADYAAVVIFGMFVVNGIMFFVFERQRKATPD